MARILVVDDDSVVLELVEELLSLQSHSLEFGHNGKEALEKLKQGPFDLLIIDRNMPVMDGVAAIAAIRRDPQLRGLKILMFTAYDSPDLRAEVLAAGADGYLCKPIKLADFSATIRQALGQ